MPRIYTEIRIAHASEEIKRDYEKILDMALKKAGYKSRTEWFNEKVRELVKSQATGIIEKLKEGKG